MDLTSFSTLFDPRDLGVHEQVAKALLTRSRATMDIELYKLNVYGGHSGYQLLCPSSSYLRRG